VTRTSFLGDSWFRNLEQACSVWMREQDGGPAPRRQPFTSEVVVLMVSGELDPVTPAGWAEPLATRYRNSRWVSIAEHSHMFADFSCMDALVSQFLDRETPPSWTPRAPGAALAVHARRTSRSRNLCQRSRSDDTCSGVSASSPVGPMDRSR
jgi:hypothetical protein